MDLSFTPACTLSIITANLIDSVLSVYTGRCHRHRFMVVLCRAVQEFKYSLLMYHWMCPLFCNYKQCHHGQSSPDFRSAMAEGSVGMGSTDQFLGIGIKGFWWISPSLVLLRWSQHACPPALEKPYFLNFHFPCSLSILPSCFLPPLPFLFFLVNLNMPVT